MKKKNACAFSYYGGKFSHLNFLLPIINNCLEVHKIKTFNDVCGGSGSVVINKNASPVDVYNDCNGLVVNFFKTLRDDKEKLIEQISLTPYSREEYNEAIESLKDWDEDITTLSNIESARRFFILARMTMNGLCTIPTKGNFKVSIGHSRRGISSVVSAYLTGIESLSDIADKFMKIQIENLDCVKCAEKYDTKNTLHYFDPPYPMETRTGGKGYKYDSTKELQDRILKFCVSCEGKIILSSYENKLYSDALLTSGYTIIESKSKVLPTTLRAEGQKVTNSKKEVVYVNF